MASIVLDVHLYGELAACAENSGSYGYANMKIELPEISKLRNLLTYLKLPTEKRGITFINSRLSALPGLQPDLDVVLRDGDRVAFFDLKSMWPFQYRDGANMTDEMAQNLSEENRRLHHTYDEKFVT